MDERNHYRRLVEIGHVQAVGRGVFHVARAAKQPGDVVELAVIDRAIPF